MSVTAVTDLPRWRMRIQVRIKFRNNANDACVTSRYHNRITKTEWVNEPSLNIHLQRPKCCSTPVLLPWKICCLCRQPRASFDRPSNISLFVKDTYGSKVSSNLVLCIWLKISRNKEPQSYGRPGCPLSYVWSGYV
jgi:hypothetical protein